MDLFDRHEIEALVQDRTSEQYRALIKQLKENNMTVNPNTKPPTKADRLADRIAAFAGSWPFIIIFLVLLVSWIVLNTVFPDFVDPFPFILLNLLLSCVAAIQAPLILMSQNREEEKRKQKEASDFYVNVKSELLLEDLHDVIYQLRAENAELRTLIEEMQRNNPPTEDY